MCLFVFVICMYICIWYLFGFLTLCIFLCNTVDCKRGLFDEKSSLVENGRGRGYRGSPVLTLMPELYWTSCPVQKSSKSGLSGNQKFSIPDAGLQNRRKNQKKSFRFFFSRFFFFFFLFVFWDTIVRVASEVHNKWRFQLFDRVHPSSRCHLFSSCRWSRVLEQFRKVKWKRFSSSFPFGYCLSIGHPETAQLIKNCNFFLQVFLSPQISTCERSAQCFTPPPPWSLYFQ